VEVDVDAGAFRDEQATAVVEAGAHWVLDQRRGGNALDDEALRNAELRSVDRSGRWLRGKRSRDERRRTADTNQDERT
jgi:hypothetical protein